MKSKRVLVFNDPHRPFHDPLALNLCLQVAHDIKVHEIYIVGDLADFYNVNSHGPKHPEVFQTLEDELIDCRDFLQKLRDYFPDAKIHFIFGNHEDRLDRFIVQHCRNFHNIVKLESQLNLERLKITHQPYNQFYQLTPDLRLQHSPPSYSVNAARTSLLRKPDMSYIYGCTHRKDYACITGSRGKQYEVFCNGWLGSTSLTKEHARVFSYAKNHENWQQCFSIVDIINDFYNVHQCLIRDRNWTTIDGGLYSVTEKDIIF